MRRKPSAPLRQAESLANELLAREDPAERRSARLAMREDALRNRLEAKRCQNTAKLAEAVAKFGGGSLLTATVLSYVSG